jgi:carboxyl-terminal processing protease
VRDLVRGQPGTAVTLSVSRGGAAPVDRRVVRDLVREPSVRARLVRDGGPPVLHVALERFHPDTAAELKAALADAEAEPAGIVLDLRGNPGGLLDQALAVADVFLDAGVILTTRDRGQRETVYRAAPYGLVRAQPPLAVLINRGSASAAEVVAASLKPSRGLLVGETSFGKGSVQQVLPLADGGGLSLTIRHYQTPGGISIQAHGIEPDLSLRTVVVGERVVFGGPTQHLREALLPRAFAAPGGPDGRGAAVAAPGPLWEVATLRTALEPVTAARTQPPAGDDPGRRAAEDFALRAALAIVREAARAGGPAGRPGVLAAARAVVPALAAQEERRIGEALAARGVDWSAPPAGAAGGASLRVEMPESVVVRPGEGTRVTLRVTNTGRATAYRVWGRTTSENPALANVDFAFGSIPPGGHREATAELVAPRAAARRWDSLGLTLREGSVESGSFAGGALMTGAGQPALSYTLQVDDENAGDPALDGDGLLARGERVLLSLSVSGDGDPGDLSLRVSPQAAGGLAIVRREQPVAAGAGGASFEGLLAAEGPPAVRLDVTLSSRAFGRLISDLVDLPLGAPYPTMLVRRPPLVSAIGELPERTSESDLDLRFAATDEIGVKDVFVLVNGRKLLYRRGAAGQSRLPVDFHVDLAPGSNLIEVVARDGDDLSTRLTYYVYRALSG